MSIKHRKPKLADFLPKKVDELKRKPTIPDYAAKFFATVQEYETWCVSQGLSTNPNKPPRQIDREKALLKSITASEQLRGEKVRRKAFTSAIEDLCNGNYSGITINDPKVQSVAEALKSGSHNRRQLFRAAAKTKLLSDRKYLDALVEVSRYESSWVRDPDTWVCNTRNIDRQFKSLVAHVLCKYKVPNFMYSAWFDQPEGGRHSKGSTYRKWFVHLAQGTSVRSLDQMPIPLTKKMAHCFLQAPEHYKIEDALRWAQIVSLGGDQRLVSAIMHTNLRTFQTATREQFWETVFHFFINNPMLDRVHCGPIIDYVESQKYHNQRIWIAGGVAEERGPAQPAFTMKGRTAEALLRQVDAWHGTLAKERKKGIVQWETTGLPGLDLVEGSAEKQNMKHWSITEILDSKTLRSEGSAMKHCVSSYEHSCVKKLCSIWSLKLNTGQGEERCLTVEVRNGEIVQARGKINRLGTPVEDRILRVWAEKAGLRLSYSKRW